MQHSTLYELCEEKDISIRRFVEQGGLIRFRRWLPTIFSSTWDDIKNKILCQFPLNNDTQDCITWGWSANIKFTVKSIYDHLTKDDSGEPNSRIWKAKIPYKIKIFLWLLTRGATLTKDNMVKRKWTGDPTCRFCESAETAEHLFFQCPTAKVVWGIVACCLRVTNILNSLINTGIGSKASFQRENNVILLAW